MCPHGRAVWLERRMGKGGGWWADALADTVKEVLRIGGRVALDAALTPPAPAPEAQEDCGCEKFDYDRLEELCRPAGSSVRLDLLAALALAIGGTVAGCGGGFLLGRCCSRRTAAAAHGAGGRRRGSGVVVEPGSW